MISCLCHVARIILENQNDFKYKNKYSKKGLPFMSAIGFGTSEITEASLVPSHHTNIIASM
jgi:hypothetical protein